MYSELKNIEGTLYRGSIPFYLINKEKKVIYISSSNKNINDFYFSVEDFSKIRKVKIENYNYTPEEFKGKNFELINFLESNENGIIFISIDSLFRKYLKKSNSILLEKNKNYKINEIKDFLI